MLGGSVPVNNIEVGYKPIAVNNMFDAITEARDDDDEEWPALKPLEPQAVKMAKTEAFLGQGSGEGEGKEVEGQRRR